jgi:tRNA threonylcarbamoyladenosine biosynthesis protein TsaE
VYAGGRLTVYHLDVYRIAGVDDLEAIGFTELLEQGGVVVVEWATRVRNLLPDRHLSIRLAVTGRDRRQIEIVESVES